MEMWALHSLNSKYKQKKKYVYFYQQHNLNGKGKLCQKLFTWELISFANNKRDANENNLEVLLYTSK